MKKLIKSLSLILCTAIFLCLLSGCKSLDTRKENQAFWNNKDHTEIAAFGKVYKKISDCEYFNPDVKSRDGMFVTKKDVPVLLAGNYALGDRYWVTEDKDLIKLGNNMIYARADVYEKYEKLIKNYTLDCFATFVETRKDNEYKQEFVLLSNSETETLKSAIAAASEGEMVEDDYAENYMSISFSDKSLLFSKYYCDFFYYKNAGKIQLYKEDKYYNITDEYKEAVLKIMQKYATSEKFDVVYE